MGSAEGRRKCCESFFCRGYHEGLSGRKISQDEWPGARFYYAGTVSNSLSGLFWRGYEEGVEDYKKGVKRTGVYHRYREIRDLLILQSKERGKARKKKAAPKIDEREVVSVHPFNGRPQNAYGNYLNSREHDEGYY